MRSLTFASLVLAFSSHPMCVTLCGLFNKPAQFVVSVTIVLSDRQAADVREHGHSLVLAALDHNVPLGLNAAPSLIDYKPANANASSIDCVSPLAERQREATALLDEMWQNTLRDSPTFATSIGDKRYTRLLPDVSPDRISENLRRDADLLRRMRALDTAGFPAEDRLNLELAERGMQMDQDGARFKEWEMPVNQFSGFQIELPQLGQLGSMETAKDYDDYVALLSAMPAYIQQETRNMELGIQERRVLPKILGERVLDEVKSVLTKKPEASGFASPLQHFPVSIPAQEQVEIRKRVIASIENKVLPAYERFASFLETEYIPHGRTDPGVWALPDGDAYYAYLIRRETTTDETPAQLHSIGLSEIERDATEEQALFMKLGVHDVHALSARIAANPNLHPISAEALVAAYRTHINAMQAKLPELFSKLPQSKLEVAAMPEFVGKSGPAAYYEIGDPKAKRLGIVRVNTYDYAHRSFIQVEATAYHEGIPGHHLQMSLAEEHPSLPAFRQFAGYMAFVEGWALYSERLGKEIGFYQDPYSDFGRIENDMWRAVRLVVDTGVHSQHWTRQQMVDVFHQYTAMDDANINAEVDRYIALPGQALAYKTGQLEILELREYAKQQLGAHFSLKAFHDQLLSQGALPLDKLTENIHAWVATQKQVEVKQH